MGSGLLDGHSRMDTQELLKRYAAGERKFVKANLSEANFSQANLREIDLSHASLSVANFSGANLGQANLQGAKLNVAKLSSTNLSRANLSQADLNVANLVRADLRGAILHEAALVRAEMIRADLSDADFSNANLSGAVLREAKLSRANFSGANFSEADLSRSTILSANLEHATFRVTNLRQADLSGSNLRNAELRQVNLCGAKLVGADLRGANLRWADLSGANLSGADLSDAKLSGANLAGANLNYASLLNASLVYADLTNANLIQADWMGADLSGATLTGTKLYGVSRFGLKIDGMTCDWVDLSPHGNGGQIHLLTFDRVEQFFNETLPTIEIAVDRVLDPESHMMLAAAYYRISREYPVLVKSPSISVGDRRTILTFRISSNLKLFATAFVAMLPFQDARLAQDQILKCVKQLTKCETKKLTFSQIKAIEKLNTTLNRAAKTAQLLKSANKEGDRPFPEIGKFFQAPTLVSLINSNNQVLEVQHHPQFGRQSISSEASRNGETQPIPEQFPGTLPPPTALLNFIQVEA